MDIKTKKSVFIHNVCRQPKVKTIRYVPKRSWKQSVKMVLREHLGIYILKVRYLIDTNISLRDAETQKGVLYGKWYFETFEHACANLEIAIKDIRISINEQFLNFLINLAKKCKLYE